MKLEAARARLIEARAKHGELMRIANESGVTYRTLFNVIRGVRGTKAETVDKLAAHFRRADRRARRD